MTFCAPGAGISTSDDGRAGSRGTRRGPRSALNHLCNIHYVYLRLGWFIAVHYMTNLMLLIVIVFYPRSLQCRVAFDTQCFLLIHHLVIIMASNFCSRSPNLTKNLIINLIPLWYDIMWRMCAFLYLNCNHFTSTSTKNMVSKRNRPQVFLFKVCQIRVFQPDSFFSILFRSNKSRIISRLFSKTGILYSSLP